MIKISLLLFFVFHFYPDSDWDLKKEKSGIEIYTRSLEGSSFDEFKGVTTIENSNLYGCFMLYSMWKITTNFSPIV